MNEIRIKSLFYSTLVVSFFQCGCNKGLDLVPINELSDVTYWKTPNDFLLAANKFYTFERTFADVLYDVAPGTTRQNYHADFKADIMATQNAFSRGLNTVPASDPNYDLAFSRLRDVNTLIAKAATYPAPADIKRYVAEAKFFRAYLYFDLLQVFGPVVIVTSPLLTDAPEIYQPRPTRDSVVNFILKDLDEAIADLPLEKEIVATEKGRVSKGAAQAFLSRVALYEGTWRKFRPNPSRVEEFLDRAIAACNAVITGGEYALFAPAQLGDSAQKYLFILENQKSNPANITKTANKEYILANRYDQTIRQIRNNVSRQASVDLTRQFANLYLCRDGLPIEKSPLFQGYATMISEYQNRDNRMRYNMKISGNYYWYGNSNWHINWDWSAPDLANAESSPWRPFANSLSGYKNQKWIAERQVPDNEEGYDFPVIRYAEVLLNYAEAVFERYDAISNDDLNKSLNLVRKRVNKSAVFPALTNAFVATNGLDMRKEIRRERTVELYYEGFRADDLKRWHNAVNGPALGGTNDDVLIGPNVLLLPLLGIKWVGTQFQTTWPAQSATLKYSGGNPFLDGALVVDATRSFSEKNYLVPLPSAQFQLNPNLVQNPDW